MISLGRMHVRSYAGIEPFVTLDGSEIGGNLKGTPIIGHTRNVEAVLNRYPVDQVLIALPMFGDYYTADLISGSAQTSMIGNQIDQFTRQGSQKTVGAVLTMLLAVVLLVLMLYYLRSTRAAGPQTAED